MAELYHYSIDETLAHHFDTKWLHQAAPAKAKRRRRRPRPAWAETLLRDRDAKVSFDQPIPCPSCGILCTGIDGAHGEIDDGGPVDDSMPQLHGDDRSRPARGDGPSPD